MFNYFLIRICSFLLPIIFLFPAFNYSQKLEGTKQSALSNSTVAQANDAFGIFTNPGGTAQIHWRELGIYYSPSPFGLKELSTASAAYIEPTAAGNFGVGFSVFGFQLYRENKLAVSYSNSFWKNHFIGITVIYQNLKIRNYGSANALNLILGGLSYITNNLRAGFSIENLLRSSYGNEENQIPVILKTGISYDVLTNSTINLALIKELGYDISVKFGAEYSPVKFLCLRAGISNYPQTFSAGIGINYSLFQLDYAMEHHNYLGITHQLGFTVQFSGFENRTEAIKHYLFEQK